MTANEAINAIAGIVRMQLDQPAEMSGLEFMFDNLDFRLRGGAPEFAIQIAAATILPGIILKAGRITNRINVKQETFREIGLDRKFVQKMRCRQCACWFVAVDRGENSDANGIQAVGTAEIESRQGILLVINGEASQGIVFHARQFQQGSKELLERSPGACHWNLCAGTHNWCITLT